MTCHLCDSHNTIAIPADTLHYAICEHILERNRKRKAGAFDSPVATPNESSPVSQPLTSCLEDGHEEEGESTASPIPPRKKPRLGRSNSSSQRRTESAEGWVVWFNPAPESHRIHYFLPSCLSAIPLLPSVSYTGDGLVRSDYFSPDQGEQSVP